MEPSVAEKLDFEPEKTSGTFIVSPGSVVAGRYKVRREIARGGMSAIVAARDLRVGRLIALKILLPRYRRVERIVDCFVAEAKMLATINNRHVVTVLDQGTITPRTGEPGLPFLALELLLGENLRNYAVGHWPLELARVARFGVQACEGVAAIHAQGITHQDLKPDNLFVSYEPNGSECLKVLDLGVALRPGMTPGEGTHGAGSPGYMSPEQVHEPALIDARSDIWSLGAVLYELFAGRAPSDSKHVRDVSNRIAGEDPARLSDVRPDLPAGISLAIERCLEHDRQQRFQNVSELAACLAPYADCEAADEAGARSVPAESRSVPAE